MLNDRHANAIKARVLILSQLLEFVVGKVSGMRIERRQHSLNRSLRRFLVIDVAGVVARDGSDSFVVVFFNLVDYAIRILRTARGEAAKLPPGADGPANDSCDEDDLEGCSDELLADPPTVV